MKRVTDIVTNEEIQKWNNGDIITIKAGTGVGKSYFIKNKLYDFAKDNDSKILMLIHRTNCVNQFEEEIKRDGKTDVIDIRTYQHLEALYSKKKQFDFKKYKYIICDEFHYFMSDASFNKTTDISLNAILDELDKIRLFMSATGDYMKRYINGIKKKNTIDYELPITFSHIRQLTFFHKDETLDNFISEYVIKRNDKAIFFIQSSTKAYELYKKFKDVAIFNCGKSDKHYKYVDKDKINNILKDEKFDELLLITTTCFDAGVNIIDEDLKHIVCDVKDKATLIQCIGRKRIQHKDDKLNLYIKTITNQQLGGIETQLYKKIEMARFLRENSLKEYIHKFPREYDKWSIVYDDVIDGEDNKATKKVNELMYFKCLTDMNDITMMKKLGEFCYCKYFAKLFGFFDGFRYNYRTIEEDYMKNSLEEYLDNIVGQKLFTTEQQELSDLIIKELVVSNKIDYRTKKLKPSTLEVILRDQLELPYAISKPKKESKGEMRGKRYILVTKIN